MKKNITRTDNKIDYIKKIAYFYFIILLTSNYSFAETIPVSGGQDRDTYPLKHPSKFSSGKNTNKSLHKKAGELSFSGGKQNDESVIVTGTHQSNKKARDSATPITVFSAQQLQQTGQLNLADALARIDPSITVNALGNDTGALTSSIRMRGLAPNEVLVLVDGKRRNTTANMVGGSSPVDLNMIPMNAVDHMEVLRGGAAAMYGSDAIAGVINIITKKSNHGLHTYAQTGANAYNGDGWQYQVGADGGMKLGQDGHIHLSGLIYHSDHFVVSQKAARDHRWTPSSNWPSDSNKVESTPEETRESLAIDWAKPITEHMQAYGLITYAHRYAESYQNYRTPSTLPEIYPYGFSPLETNNENFFQANTGLKGDNFLGFDWDLSTLYGQDQDDIGVKNTYNSNYAAVYGSSPTIMNAERYRMSQWTSNFDMRRNFNIGHVVPMTLAMGAEHRLEMYHVGAGNPASYLYGGTSGYAGITPALAGNWQRNVWAGYVDGDFHPLKKWELDFSGRFEHYTDAGDTETGKITTRYNITKRIAVRADINNGFRAPTLAEEHYSSVNVSPTGASGVLAANSESAKSIGANRLKPERSTSESAGIVLEPVDNFHITADVYQINIRDRITSSMSVAGDTAIDAISSAGVNLPTGGTIDSRDIKAYYYANSASTRTQGLDIQSDYRLRMEQWGILDLSMLLNLNRTTVHHLNTNTAGNAIASASTVAGLMAVPRSKIILDAHWSVDKWDINIRETRYGSTKTMLSYLDLAPSSVRYSTTEFKQFVNTPVWTTDLEVGYRFNRQFHLAIGANNIFNMRPRHVDPVNNYLGPKIYDSSSALSMVGAYYYARLDASF